MEIKHPNYYKNLRKLARLRNRDQAISLRAHDGECERAPGTGLKQRDSQVVNQVKMSSQSQASSSMMREPRKSFTVLGPRASTMMKVFFGCLTWKLI